MKRKDSKFTSGEFGMAVAMCGFLLLVVLILIFGR